jgi:hypothetical protein
MVSSKKWASPVRLLVVWAAAAAAALPMPATTFDATLMATLPTMSSGFSLPAILHRPKLGAAEMEE